MSQELPYQRLLEEFGSAFNVEGLTEIQLTWEGKGKILEEIVDRARWWLGLGNRSREPQNYQQAVTGVREVIAANTNDSRFSSLSTSWALNVSCSFFDKLCSLVEESERRKNVEKIGPQKNSGQRRLLPAPTLSAQPFTSVTANSPQSTPFPLQGTSNHRGEWHSPPTAHNPIPANSSGTTSSRKRKFSEDSAVAKRGGKDKGKGRAMSGSYGEGGTGFTTFAKPPTVNPLEQNLLRRIPSPIGVGGAGPSNWDSKLKGSRTIHYPIQLNGSTASGFTAPASSQQNPRVSSQKTVPTISKIHTQFLLRIKKANLTALTPSQRVQLNLCISQANHLEGVPHIPLIRNAPKLYRNTSSSAHSLAVSLVKDCQDALSLAVPLLPSSIPAIPVYSSGVTSGTVENPSPKRAKTHKNLNEPSEEHRQGGQTRHSQKILPLRKPTSGPVTKIRASMNTQDTYIHAADSEAQGRLATAVCESVISFSEPMPTSASPQIVPPSLPRVTSMASPPPSHSSAGGRGSPSYSIQQPAAIQQAAYHQSAGISIPMSTASSPSVPTARRASDNTCSSTQTIQAPLDLPLLPPYYQPLLLGDSANPIYNTIHPNPTPAATPSLSIGNQDNGISGNDTLLNNYEELAFFDQYLNIPVEEYIGGQVFQVSQLQFTTSPMYGQQMGDFSQRQFQGMSQQGGVHMFSMSMTGHGLISPYQPQQMQWAPDSFQACPPGSRSDSGQNSIALD